MKDLFFGAKIGAVMFIAFLALMLVLAWINSAHAYTYCSQSRYSSSCWSTPEETYGSDTYGSRTYVPPPRMRPPYETEQ